MFFVTKPDHDFREKMEEYLQKHWHAMRLTETHNYAMCIYVAVLLSYHLTSCQVQDAANRGDSLKVVRLRVVGQSPGRIWEVQLFRDQQDPWSQTQAPESSVFLLAKERLETASCRVHSKIWHSVPGPSIELNSTVAELDFELWGIPQSWTAKIWNFEMFFQKMGGLRSYSTQRWRHGLRGAAGVAAAPSVGQPGRRLCSPAPSKWREVMERKSCKPRKSHEALTFETDVMGPITVTSTDPTIMDTAYGLLQDWTCAWTSPCVVKMYQKIQQLKCLISPDHPCSMSWPWILQSSPND